MAKSSAGNMNISIKTKEIFVDWYPHGKFLHFNEVLLGPTQILTNGRNLAAQPLSPLRYVWEKFL